MSKDENMKSGDILLLSQLMSNIKEQSLNISKAVNEWLRCGSLWIAHQAC